MITSFFVKIINFGIKLFKQIKQKAWGVFLNAKNINPVSMVNVVIAVSIVSLLISFTTILAYFIMLSNESRKLKVIQEVATVSAAVEQTADTPKTEQEIWAENFQNLYNQNQDIVAWINIPDTEVNYPVMQTKDQPEYYLRRGFDKEYSFSGTPFLDAYSNIQNEGENIVVYAHNMKNNTMFSVLESYLNASFWEQNKLINFNTSEDMAKYEVFASFIIDTDIKNANALVPYQNLNNASKIDVEQYIEFLEEYSKIKPEIDAQKGDSFLTLSTCTNDRKTDRIVVVAKKIE